MKVIGRRPGSEMFAPGQRIPIYTSTVIAEDTAANTEIKDAAYVNLSSIPDGMVLKLALRGFLQTGTAGTAVLQAVYYNTTASLTTTTTDYTAMSTVVTIASPIADTVVTSIIGDAATAYVDTVTTQLFLETY